MKFDTAFDIADRVNIDDDRSITATVTRINISGIDGALIEYEAAWFNNGATVSAWFPGFRLTMARE